jgi:hypothetical protein
MVERLVAFSIDAALRDPDSAWLREIFSSGFPGFRAMRRAQLVKELQFRGLLPQDADPAGDPEEGDDEWYDAGAEGEIARCIPASSA